MIFSDSVTQQFSDPHSIGFKVPYPEFEKLTLRTRDDLFLLRGSAFPFLQHSVLRHLPPSRQLSHPPSCAQLPRLEFSPPSRSLAWPKALIAKLVYIGEINALQMRLNTYSKKCRQCVSGLSPKSGGRKKEHLCSTKLESQSEACRYSPSHPLLWRKRGGFGVCMLVCNSWHYITCRQQSNSCGIVKVLFHTGEQSVEFHSRRKVLLTTWMQSVHDRCRHHSKILPKKKTKTSEDQFMWHRENTWSLGRNSTHSLWSLCSFLV